jgi:hypothetical protein
MAMSFRGTGLLLLLLIVAVAAPGYASAQLAPPVPDAGACRTGKGPCAVLYETTENLKIQSLRDRHRMAISALLGFAVRGTPLCPDNLMPVRDPLPDYCALNVSGADNISFTTGLGQFRGSVTVVVQELNAAGMPTPDSPELVIARGRFTGDMNFAPAILHSVPLGSVVGRVSLDGFGSPAPFTGVFRLPFVMPKVDEKDLQACLAGPDPASCLTPPLYLTDTGAVPVNVNETAIGYPTVRFEISF